MNCQISLLPFCVFASLAYMQLYLPSLFCRPQTNEKVEHFFRIFFGTEKNEQWIYFISCFSDQATVLCCPKDNHRYALSCIPDIGEPSFDFQYAGQSATLARFDYSKSICPQHLFYENNNFLHHSISYIFSRIF
jgi:hypothetical protein